MADIQPEKHVCSPCEKEFATAAEYLAHACEKAGGKNPTDPEYLKATTTPNFDAVSAAAKKRGAKK
jgi:hypothetical protein